MVDHSKNSGEFKSGTIGEMNGGNYATVDVEWDVDWLFAFLARQKFE